MKKQFLGAMLMAAVGTMSTQAFAEKAAKTDDAGKAGDMACQNQECKGKSACAGFGNESCAGHNACKGHGTKKAANEAECKKAKGKWTKKS